MGTTKSEEEEGPRIYKVQDAQLFKDILFALYFSAAFNLFCILFVLIVVNVYALKECV